MFQSWPREVYLESLGAALYRAGEFRAAVRELSRAVDKHGKDGSVWTLLFLAMSHHRLGHPEEVREALALAVRQIEATNSPSWRDQVRWRHLRNEAEALLQAPAPRR